MGLLNRRLVLVVVQYVGMLSISSFYFLSKLRVKIVTNEIMSNTAQVYGLLLRMSSIGMESRVAQLFLWWLIVHKRTPFVLEEM